MWSSDYQLIPQRGCAFACFDTRQEAARALQGLNDLKLLDKNLKVRFLVISVLIFLFILLC